MRERIQNVCYLNNATRIFEEASLTQLRQHNICYRKQRSTARIMSFTPPHHQHQSVRASLELLTLIINERFDPIVTCNITWCPIYRSLSVTVQADQPSNSELFVLMTQFLPRSRHFVLFVKTSQLMLYWAEVAVCCEVDISAVCWQSVYCPTVDCRLSDC